MKFGNLEDGIPVDRGALPNDDPRTHRVLSASGSGGCKVYVGCPEWGSSSFDGLIFPKGTKSKEFRVLYAQQFNAVELNATGYRIPSMNTVEGWTKGVPDDFMFCPKVPQPISQVKPIGKNDRDVIEFVNAIRAFGEHLGAVFLQLHPNYGVSRMDELITFLDRWDGGLPLHVELRAEDWNSNLDIRSKFFDFLQSKGIGTVITDTPNFPQAVHQTLTTSRAYIRFSDSAAALNEHDLTRLHRWAERCMDWMELGLKQLFFFCHAQNHGLSPVLCDLFIAELNRIGNSNLKRPTFLASVVDPVS